MIMDLLNVSWRPIKEPRGMIRLLQILFAIIAFATTSGFNYEAKLEVKCDPKIPTSKDVIKSYTVAYPFSDSISNTFIRCNDTNVPPKEPLDIKLELNEATSSQFWVTTGVLSMLYASGIVVLYVLAPTTYAENKLVPFVDLVLTIVLTAFWFLGWCSWVANYGNVKDSYYNLPKVACHELLLDESQCNISGVSFGKLVVSLIAGFADIFLWGASCWFVFKETSFHQEPNMDPGYVNHNQQVPSPS